MQALSFPFSEVATIFKFPNIVTLFDPLYLLLPPVGHCGFQREQINTIFCSIKHLLIRSLHFLKNLISMWLKYFYSEQVQVLLILKNVIYESRTPYSANYSDLATEWCRRGSFLKGRKKGIWFIPLHIHWPLLVLPHSGHTPSHLKHSSLRYINGSPSFPLQIFAQKLLSQRFSTTTLFTLPHSLHHPFPC